MRIVEVHLARALFTFDAGFIFLVPPTEHPINTLTNMKKKPYIYSPITVLETLFQLSFRPKGLIESAGTCSLQRPPSRHLNEGVCDMRAPLI